MAAMVGMPTAGGIGMGTTSGAYSGVAAQVAYEKAKKAAGVKASDAEGVKLQEDVKTGAAKITPQQAAQVRQDAARRLWGRIKDTAKQAAPYVGAAAAAAVVYLVVED